MKQRTPLFINIIIVLVLIYMIFFMIIQNNSLLITPYFIGTAILGIVVTIINHTIIGNSIEKEKLEKLSEEERKAYLAEKNIPFLTRMYKSAFKSQSAEEEKEILIDHGFDGIMELDNQLPKWWLGLFWIGIVYCVVYIIFYFGGIADFANADKEYDEEYKKELVSVAAYEADPKNIVTIETAKYSQDNVEAGKEVFQSNCVSCHMDGGKGGIGPNLTDKFWINQPEKTLFKNIYHVVENGSPNNPAMQAFGKNGVLTGKDIQNVAAFVYHINQEQAPITEKEGGAASQGTEAHWANE